MIGNRKAKALKLNEFLLGTERPSRCCCCYHWQPTNRTACNNQKIKKSSVACCCYCCCWHGIVVITFSRCQINWKKNILSFISFATKTNRMPADHEEDGLALPVFKIAERPPCKPILFPLRAKIQ